MTLVRATEQLVAERGLRGVSAREVVKAAGHRNNSAITYHFGSWEALLARVWDLHAIPVDIERAAMIEGAYANGEPDLSTLVRAYIVPLVSEIGRYQPSYWAQFNEQWMVGNGLNFMTTPERCLQPEDRELDTETLAVLHTLFKDLATHLPHLPEPDRHRRVTLMARFVIMTLAAWERDEGSHSVQPLEILGRELTTLAVALLRAP